jgi:Uma2 family endonuclease
MSVVLEAPASTPERATESPSNGRIYTPDDLLSMPNGDRYELIDGTLVERDMGAESCMIATRLMRQVGNHFEPRFGVVFASDCGYQIFPKRPNLVRFPDGSAMRWSQLPGGVVPKGHMRVLPDMMLEVVSPNDDAYDVQEKIELYLEVGVPLVWLVYPPTQRVFVHRPGQSINRLTPSDQLDGGDIIPGFSYAVADLFASSAPAPA